MVGPSSARDSPDFPSEVPPAVRELIHWSVRDTIRILRECGYDSAAIRRRVLDGIKGELPRSSYSEAGKETILALYQAELDAALGPP